MRFRNTFRTISVMLALLSTFDASSQHLLSDTIAIESVSISRNRTGNLLQKGLKSISIDTLVLNEKKGLSLAELLQENSPIFIKTYGRGATATASLRGTSASHTKVYWNGLQVNSPMSGEADFSLVPLYFVDDVAIHVGQSSMRYGNGGLGGAVSLQSIPDWSKQLGATIYQSIGSYDTYSTAVKSTYGKGKIKAQTRLFRESSENNFSFHNIAKIDQPLEVQHNADYKKYGALQEVYYRPSDNAILSAKVWAQQTDRGIPPLMTSFSAAEYNRQNDINLNYIVDYKMVGNTVSWGVATGISHMNLLYDYSKLSVEGNPLPVLSTRSKSWSWYNRASAQWKPLSWLSAALQAEVNGHWVESTEAIMNTGYAENQTHSLVKTSVNINPTNRISLSALLAQEMFDSNIMPLSYSIAFKYSLIESNTLFANGGYSRNHNNPSLNDLYWQPGGNINLLPEDAKSWEGGLNYTIENQKFKLDISGNLFASSISNWIMWLPHLKGYWEPVNLTQVSTQGLEFALQAEQTIGNFTLKIRGNYSNTQSTIQNAGGVMRPEAHGKQLPFIPVHSGGVVANVLVKPFYVTYTFTHFSERYTTTSNNPNSLRRLYPYYMSSVALGCDFSLYKMPVGIQLRVDNLLNESYQTIMWRPMPGRNYSLSINIKL